MTDTERHKLLVIDDSELVLAAQASALAEAGFDVRAVSSLRSFLNALLDWKPHVVVTDLYMPEMSGAELCTWIRRHVPTARIPIVVCSAAPMSELEVIARDVGADAAISKAAGLTELQSRLRDLCDSIVW